MKDRDAIAKLLRVDRVDVAARILAEISCNIDEIVELAVSRACGPGLDEYGDASFRKTADELHRERFEEYADAWFYACVEKRVGSQS